MQAIIMAGGEGTRLRPLTSSIPKPLAPLCGKPVLLYILELLRSNSFTKATLTLMYQSDRITSYFDNDMYRGMELSYSYEDEPLGTAGSVKKACTDDEVIVISGDAMCDFDLLSAIEFHHNIKADATIIVKKVSDPREFGLVLYNSDGRITGFAEKPSFESCTTDMANTGVYILSRKALDIISENTKSDFARDIFPLMLSRKMKLFAYEEKGYWCDIGSIGSYMKCQHDMLDGRVLCKLNVHKDLDGAFCASPYNMRGVKLIPPCYIGRNVSIGAGTVIEAGTVICDDVSIGCNSRLHGAVILEGAYLGERVLCSECLVCQNAIMNAGSSAFENSIIGEKALIGENSTVEANVRVWQSKQIDRNVVASYDVRYGNSKGYQLDEDGLCGETNMTMSANIAAIAGSSFASCFSHYGSVALAYSERNSSLAFAMAFSSGALSSGSDVWDFGECTESELVYCMKISGIRCACYIDSEKTTTIKLISENGLPLTRSQERKIESGINTGSYCKALFNEFGEYKKSYGIKELYKNSLADYLPQRLDGLCPEFKSGNKRVISFLSEIIPPRIDINGSRIIFHISGDGKKVSAYTEQTGYVFYEKLVVLVCKIRARAGKDTALPYSFPLVADKVANGYGTNIKRYYNCTFDTSDMEARALSGECDFVNDGIRLSFIILSYLSENKQSLADATDDIPEFYATSRYVSLDSPASDILKALCPENAGIGEGVAIKENDDRVLIRPVKTGKGIQMFVESVRSETAQELCDRFEKLLHGL